jgi:hypothetical protein
MNNGKLTLNTMLGNYASIVACFRRRGRHF